MMKPEIEKKKNKSSKQFSTKLKKNFQSKKPIFEFVNNNLTMTTLFIGLLFMVFTNNLNVEASLCSHLSSGQMNQIRLQSVTYLQWGDRKVYLMANDQLHRLPIDGLRVRGTNPLAPPPNDAERFWDVNRVLVDVMVGSKIGGANQAPIEGVTVLLQKWFFYFSIHIFSELYFYVYRYYGVIRTADQKVHVVQVAGREADTDFDIERAEFYKTGYYPPFQLVPRFPDDSGHRAYVFQFDEHLKPNEPTTAPAILVYKLYFSGLQPEIATPGSMASFDPAFYLVADKTNADKVSLKSTRSDGAKEKAKESPLLHRVPIGFESGKSGDIYLIEPDIYCVYALEGFWVDEEREVKLTRTPLEQFFSCPAGDSRSAGNYPGFPVDRCDSVEKSKEFFAKLGAIATPAPPAPETEPETPSIDPLIPGGGMNESTSLPPPMPPVVYPAYNKKYAKAANRPAKANWFMQGWVVGIGLLLIVLTITLIVVWVVRTGKSSRKGRKHHKKAGKVVTRREHQPGGETGSGADLGMSNHHRLTPTTPGGNMASNRATTNGTRRSVKTGNAAATTSPTTGTGHGAGITGTGTQGHGHGSRKTWTRRTSTGRP